MSSHTVSFTSNTTWTIPSSAIGGTITFVVTGACGNWSHLSEGGKGAVVTGSAPLSKVGATLKIRLAYHPSGGGGSYGGSTAVLSATTALLVEAGGGGNAGATQQNGSGSWGLDAGTPNAPSTGTHNGGGATTTAGGRGGTAAGPTGSVAGTPGTATSGGKAGHGDPTKTYDGGGAGGGGRYGGGGGGGGTGPGGGGGGGGGSSYADPTLSVTYGLTSTNSTPGSVAVTYQTLDKDLKPTLLGPGNGTSVDMSAAGYVKFKRNPGTTSGTMVGFAVRRQLGTTAAEYWTATTAKWVATLVFVAAASATAEGTTSYKYTFPTGKWTDGKTYNWSVATQNSKTTVTLHGTFATTFVVQATAMPTITTLKPTATSTTPAIVKTGKPRITWTETLATGDSQIKYRAVIYTKAQTLASGFVAGTSASVFDTGTKTGTTQTVTVTTLLTNDQTYVLYVKIVETGTVSSVWTSQAFKVSFTPATAPSITVTESNDTNGRPRVSVSCTEAVGAAIYVEVQRSTNGGTTWTAAPGTSTHLTLTTGSVTFIDNYAPLGITLKYRARAWKQETTQWVSSTWSLTSSVKLPNDQWWICDAATPADSLPIQRGRQRSAMMSGAGTGSISFTQKEMQGRFACFGRPNYVTVHGTMMNQEFELTMDWFGDTWFDRLVTLRNKQSVYFIQSDMPGDTYFVTLGSTRPAVLMRATTRKTTPVRQVVLKCFPATPVT